MHSPVLQTCLLLHQWLDQTHPETPLPPTSDHPPNFFAIATIGISNSAVLHHWEQPRPIFELNSLLPFMSSQFCQNYSTAVEAIVSHLVKMHLWILYTYFSLLFQPWQHGSGGCGPLFLWIGCWETKCLLKMQNQFYVHTLFLNMQRLLKLNG